MKKFGFTLAEILIALGIVGVVAAITIPSLSSNANKQAYAKGLSVAVSDFETAMKNMIEREDVPNIKQTPAWINGRNLTTASSDADIQVFVNDLTPYLQIASFDKRSRVYKFLNTQSKWSIPGVKYKTKKGPEYIINFDNNNTVRENAYANGSTYTEKVAEIIIDTNGSQTPNMIGRDLFFYDLGSDGTLYPVGSKDVNSYNANNAADADSFTNGCTGAIRSNCSEYLRQNGYKMDY